MMVGAAGFAVAMAGAVGTGARAAGVCFLFANVGSPSVRGQCGSSVQEIRESGKLKSGVARNTACHRTPRRCRRDGGLRDATPVILECGGKRYSARHRFEEVRRGKRRYRRDGGLRDAAPAIFCGGKRYSARHRFGVRNGAKTEKVSEYKMRLPCCSCTLKRAEDCEAVRIGRRSVMQMRSVHHWVRANKSVTCSFSTLVPYCLSAYGL